MENENKQLSMLSRPRLATTTRRVGVEKTRRFIDQKNRFLKIADKIPRSPQTHDMPEFYIDPAMLSLADGDLETLNRELLQTETTVLLEYTQGYPVICETGLPVWQQMPHEPNDLYQLFYDYCRMPHNQEIQVYDPHNHESQNQSAHHSMRSLHMLEKTAHIMELEMIEVYTASNFYFWADRAKAYDLFLNVAEVKRRENVRRRVEAEQFEKATKLIENVYDNLLHYLEEPMHYEVKMSDLIRLYTLMTKQQRVSIGLKEVQTEHDLLTEGSRNSSDIFKSLRAAIAKDKDSNDNMLTLDALRNDPQMLEAAENIVFQMQTNGDKDVAIKS